MLDYLYPRIYFSPDGDEEGGGSDYGDSGDDSDDIVFESEDEIAADDLLIDPYTVPTITNDIDVSTIPGIKSITSFLIPSNSSNPLIYGSTEGNIPSQGLDVLAYIIGNPGGKFYLNIKDIDDDQVLNLTNVEIPASGKYTVTITFPSTNITNKYKINLRAGDGSRLSTSLPKTDPMWTIHQYAKPTVTFTKATGTATGVTYSGDDVTFTADTNTSLNIRTSAHQSTFLRNGTSMSTHGTFKYDVTAAKGGALVYIKDINVEFANNTSVIKRVKEDVVNSNVINLENVDNLLTGMTARLNTYTKTKLYNIDSLTLKLSDTGNLTVGMFIRGGDTIGSENAFIKTIRNNDEITISNNISADDRAVLEFIPTNRDITIKSIDKYLKRITLEHEVGKINNGTLLSFKNEEMRFATEPTISNSGSASTTFTNIITMQRFGTKDVTFTFPTDDIFTLTPNASDQNVDVIKETATDIIVLFPSSNPAI